MFPSPRDGNLMTNPNIKKFLLVILLFSFSLLNAEDEALSPMLKNLVFNSDHIVTGAIENITTEVNGRITLSKATVKIQDVISSDRKPGDVITVVWETHELLPIHHENFKGIQMVMLLQKKGDLYYANHPSRFLSLEDYEAVYKEINNYSTRVFLPENFFLLDHPKPVLLIFRNIEAETTKLPILEIQENSLKINDKIVFSIFPITSFNREKTILAKDPLPSLPGKIQVTADTLKELKTDEEYRVWIDLNSFYSFKKSSYYSVTLSIKGFPSQGISAFETRPLMKIPSKFDFLLIAKDRFATEQKKHTVQMLMDAVNETSVERAFEKLSKLKSLCLSNKEIKDLSPIGSFTQLEVLDLSGNKIQDVNPIRQMRSLIFLDLSNNQIKNLDVIGYLSNINLLDLSRNEIEDISPIKNLLSVFFLYLRSNDIENINDLDALKRLRVLDLSKNEIEDIKALGKLLFLQELYLQENQVKVLDPLTFSRNLTILDVRKNPVSYVEHFDPLIKKHVNDFGVTIELKLIHDAFTEKNETEKVDDQLLPAVGEKNNFEVKEKIVKEEKVESFSEQVEKATGIKSEKVFVGNVVEFLDAESLLLIQFKTEELPVVDNLLTVYRKNDYIGTVKVIEISKEQVIGKIMPELLNDKKLTFAVGDSARVQK
jgi:Leucine-rich repeat (LRR) protein